MFAKAITVENQNGKGRGKLYLLLQLIVLQRNKEGELDNLDNLVGYLRPHIHLKSRSHGA